MKNNIIRRILKFIPCDMPVFLWQFIKNPKGIGSIIPSSPKLASAMTHFMGDRNLDTIPKKYLEVGAGTGPITEAIIHKMKPFDTLDVIENNPKFFNSLQKKYSHLPNVNIHGRSVLEWSPEYKYDVIVSSLPFNALEANCVSDIYKHYQNIAKPGGIVSYFEYIALPGIKKLLISPRSREEFQKTIKITKQFQQNFEIRTDKVLANFPPSYVHHCQFPA